MRKLLYGTSALVAAGLLHVDPAFAQAKESPVTLTVGGRFHFMYAFADQKDGTLGAAGTDIRGHGITREAEILFRGRTALNNGLRVGVHVGLEAEDCADQIDESYIWFEHDSFGRAELGSTDQVGWKMFYGAPAAIPNNSTAQINTRSYNLTAVTAGVTAPGNASPQALLNMGNDAEHLNYFTPRFFGFQVGVSYTPENCQEGAAAAAQGFTLGAAANTCTGAGSLPSKANAGQQGDLFELAANFVQKFGDVNVGIYGAANWGDLEAQPAGGVGRDQKQWGVGAQLAAWGFTVGAHYKHDNLGVSGGDYDSWGAGLSYKWDAWTIGAEYGWVRATAYTTATGAVTGAKDRSWVGMIGVQYAGIGPGINTFAGVQFFDQNGASAAAGNASGAGAGNDGTVFILGTTITY